MNHRELNVWKESMTLVTMVYSLIASFPKSEEFSLSSQMRRSSISIPSNIAEGCGRGTNKEMYRFCNIASGSLSELETQLLIAESLGYIEYSGDVESQLIKVRKLLSGFKRHIIEQINNNKE